MANTKHPSQPAPQKRQGTMPKGQQATVVGIVVLCVAAVIGVALLLNRGGDDEAAGAISSHPSPTSVDDVLCDDVPEARSEGEQFASPPPASLAEDTTWEGVIHTTCGDVRVELDGKVAPQTVASFIFLAQQDYWNDGGCHRLTTQGIFVLQCGDPTGTGTVTPPYGFGIENAPADGDYPRGTLAMARGASPDSNGGQFFLVYQDTQLPTTGGGYSIFGKVTEGMDIIDAIAKEGGEDKRDDAPPFQNISILSVDVEKKQ